jgi:hypothetical protein
LIDAEKATYAVAWMCRMLGVPRSSFHAWRHRAETVTAARRRDLTARIERIFTASRGTYGCRRVAAELNREGRPASVGLVADLMRELGLRLPSPSGWWAGCGARCEAPAPWDPRPTPAGEARGRQAVDASRCAAPLTGRPGGVSGHQPR